MMWKMLCLYLERNLAWPELETVYAHMLKFVNKPHGILLSENSIADLYSRPGKDTRILIKKNVWNASLYRKQTTMISYSNKKKANTDFL